MPFFALTVGLLLTACGGDDTKAVATAAASQDKPRVTFSSPVKFSADPGVKQRQQSDLVAMMVKDPRIDIESLKGEAMRRGITLSPEQLAFKQSQVIDKKAPFPQGGEATPGNSAQPAVSDTAPKD